MRKILVTRQFFEVSDLKGHFFDEKGNKKWCRENQNVENIYFHISVKLRLKKDYGLLA